MADAMQAIRTYILAQSSVSDLIGQRLYLTRRPQSQRTLPCATIKRSSESWEHVLGGLAGVEQTRFQIVVYSDNQQGTTGASQVAKAIAKCGVVSLLGTTNGVDIRGVEVEDGRREYDVEDPEAGDQQTYVTEFDLMVAYKE